MTGPSTSTSAMSAPRALACSLCQRRKVKCDHNKPCGNCVKADVPCIPAPPPMPRRRRQPNAELRTRLARCEILLEKFAGVQDLTGTPSTTSAAQSTFGDDDESPSTAESPLMETPSGFDDVQGLGSPATHRHEREWASTPMSRLVDEHGSTRFTDSLVWGMVSEEIKAMQTIIGSDAAMATDVESIDLHEDRPGCQHCLNIMTREEEHARPSAAQMIRLWQVFLDRVHPVTKILHAPSFQPSVVDATSNFEGQPWAVQALLFAIFQVAVISLDEDECVALMKVSRDQAVRRFSSAVRSILHRNSFLKNNDLTVLQTIVLQMISGHGRSNPRASWILNGLCVRMAQGLGLHKDGEALGLPPFETEMRRRVWWQIVLLDLHSAFSSGLAPSLPPRYCDCKLPTNLNDSDMNPGATQYFTDRPGPTEMIVCLLNYRVGEFLTKTPGFHDTLFVHEAHVLGVNARADPNAPAQIDAQLKLVDRALEETMAQFSHPAAGPIHELANRLRYSFSGKFREMLLSPMQSVASPQDRLFDFVISDIGHVLDTCKSLRDKTFRWFMRMFFAQKGFFYMVGQLCQRTTGPVVDAAWKRIEDAYLCFADFADMSHSWNLALGTLVLRAWDAREAALTGLLGQKPAAPACVDMLRDRIGVVGEPAPGSVQTPRGAAPGTDSVWGGLDMTSYNSFDTSNSWPDAIDDAQMDWGLWAATVPARMDNL